jgi:VanZ family protein
MKTLILFLILLATEFFCQNTQSPFSTQPQPKTLATRWNNMDDYGKHFFVSGLITGVSGVVCYKITKKQWLSVGVGAVTGIASGIFKEVIWDGMMKRGVVSNRDFIASTNGALVGTFVITAAFDMSAKKKKDRLERYYKLRKQHSNNE